MGHCLTHRGMIYQLFVFDYRPTHSDKMEDWTLGSYRSRQLLYLFLLHFHMSVNTHTGFSRELLVWSKDIMRPHLLDNSVPASNCP